MVPPTPDWLTNRMSARLYLLLQQKTHRPGDGHADDYKNNSGPQTNGRFLVRVHRRRTSLKDIVKITRAVRKIVPLNYSQRVARWRRIAAGLRNAGLSYVSISLDHWDELEHDRARRFKGAFRSALKAIEIFKNLGDIHVGVLPCSPNTCLTRNRWSNSCISHESGDTRGVAERDQAIGGGFLAGWSHHQRRRTPESH